MELLFRLLGVVQNLLCTILNPIYWFVSKMETVVLMQPIRRSALKMSASQLAAKVRTGEITCEDLMQEFSFRSRRVNVKLNAVVEDRYNTALEEAEKLDELIASKSKTIEEMEKETPLLGIPITVKESCKVKGLSYCVGSKLRVGQKADCDGGAVELLRKAGAIPILVSNTPELCMASETHNLVTGLTRNPYHGYRSAGGSSGGEAALLSSAGSVIGVGSDLIGSILCPSMFTGIFGHRPTPGVISVEGHCPGGEINGLASHLTVGPMCRYAEDLPLMLRVMAGNKATLLKLDEQVDLKKLKIHYMTGLQKSLGIPSVEKEIKIAIKKAVEHFKTIHKCNVQEANFAEMSDAPEMIRSVMFAVKDLPDIFTLTNYTKPKGHLSVFIEFFKSLFGLGAFSYPPLMFYLMKMSNNSFPVEKTQLYLDKNKILKQKVIETLGDDGVLIFPTYPTTAPYHHQSLIRLLSSTYCGIASMLGLPSTHVPMGLNKKGLPIGFQVIGGPNQDRLCLAVAKELENAFGGWVHPPSLQVPSERKK